MGKTKFEVHLMVGESLLIEAHSADIREGMLILKADDSSMVAVFAPGHWRHVQRATK